jgi:hypothetical protein
LKRGRTRKQQSVEISAKISQRKLSFSGKGTAWGLSQIRSFYSA